MKAIKNKEKEEQTQNQETMLWDMDIIHILIKCQYDRIVGYLLKRSNESKQTGIFWEKKMHFVLTTPKYVIFVMSIRTSKFQVHLYLFQQDWSNYIFMFIITALHWSEWFWSTGMIIRLSWYWSRKNFTFYCHCKLWEVECKFFLFLFKVKIHRHRILINHTHPINCDLWG